MRVYRGGGGGGIAFDAGSSSCCSFLFSSIARLFSRLFFSLSLARERASAQMGPTDLHKAESSVPARSHRAGASLLLNALSRVHTHTTHARRRTRVSFIKGAASSADTEAPRIPCCANNTTAHIRDISFYYYPCIRFLSLLLCFFSCHPPPVSSLSLFLSALGPRPPFRRARPLVHRVHDAVNFACARWFIGDKFYFTGVRLSVLDIRQFPLEMNIRNCHTSTSRDPK